MLFFARLKRPKGINLLQKKETLKYAVMNIGIYEIDTEHTVALLLNQPCIPSVGEHIIVSTAPAKVKRYIVKERVFGILDGENIKGYDVSLWVEEVK